MTETRSRGFLGFPLVYWLANLLELFERGAYYGMLAIFVFHVRDNLGMTESFAGLAVGILQPFLYFVPIFSAPLTLKFGYRKSLLVLFVFLAGGYVLMGLTGTKLGILAGIVVFGIAAGVFKPIIAAVVSRTTNDENRNLGFSLYYWMINAGAFLAPLVIGFTIPEEKYGYVFFVAAAAITLNILLTFLLFRDPELPKEAKTVGQALGELKIVLSDWKFTALIILYSGFFFVYAMNHVVLPIYMRDFTNMPDWFSVAFLGTINPGTIILLGPILGKIVERFHALPTMIVGIVIFLAGFTLIGFWPIWLMFLLGIIIASIGEFVTHPNFISHVAGTSPRDKVDLYLGYIFLPIGIGYTTGSIAGGVLYENIAKDLLMPKFFWGVVISVGVLTIVSLLLYNRIVQGAEARRALTNSFSRFLVSRRAAVILALFIPVLLVAGYAAPPLELQIGTEGFEVGEAVFTATGTLAEGDSHVETLALDMEDLVSIHVVLAWTDEDPLGAGTPAASTNQPDRFRVTLTAPDGTVVASGEAENAVGQEGRIVLDLILAGEGDDRSGDVHSGEYEVFVALLDAGDEQPILPLVPSQMDAGNDWSLEVMVKHWVPEEMPPQQPKA